MNLIVIVGAAGAECCNLFFCMHDDVSALVFSAMRRFTGFVEFIVAT